jgi:alpha-tubulin suppressor-like RCC1 family protein
VGGIKTDGTFWTWGVNYKGMLGLNESSPGPAPGSDMYSSPVQLGTGTDWAHARWGEYCTMAVKTDGTLWSWGYNASGLLGLNSTIPWPSGGESSPRQVGTDTTWSTSMETLSTGYNASGAIKTDGTLWMWGGNGQGQLALNNKTGYSSPKQVGTDTDWSVLTGAGAVGVHAIKTDGTLWSWGQNNLGNLGHNNKTQYSSPVQIPGTWSKINSIALQATMGVKTDGTLWTWGSNEHGELGQNTGSPTMNLSSPTQVGTGTDWSDVRGFIRNAMAIKTDGSLWGWGSNYQGTIGDGTNVKRSSPVQIAGTWDMSYVSEADTSSKITMGKQSF